MTTAFLSCDRVAGCLQLSADEPLWLSKAYAQVLDFVFHFWSIVQPVATNFGSDTSPQVMPSLILLSVGDSRPKSIKVGDARRQWAWSGQRCPYRFSTSGADIRWTTVNLENPTKANCSICGGNIGRCMKWDCLFVCSFPGLNIDYWRPFYRVSMVLLMVAISIHIKLLVTELRKKPLIPPAQCFRVAAETAWDHLILHIKCVPLDIARLLEDTQTLVWWQCFLKFANLRKQQNHLENMTLRYMKIH